MGKVIGPISLDDWFVMRMLRESIADMKSKDSNRYQIAINKHTAMYKDYISSYNKAAGESTLTQKVA